MNLIQMVSFNYYMIKNMKNNYKIKKISMLKFNKFKMVFFNL